MFYGAIVKPGKPTVCVPPPDDHALHLSQASLSAAVKEGTRVSLLAKVGTEDPIILCTLRAGTADTVLLDQFLAEYTELTVEGKAEIHVTGYYSPQLGEEDGEELDEGEEGDEGYAGNPYEMIDMHSMDVDDSEEDEGEEESDEDEDSGDEAVPSFGKMPSVVIEDITDQVKEHPAKANGILALPASGKPAAPAGSKMKKGAVQDVHEPSDDDEESDEDSDEDEAEEERQQQQQLQVGTKRKAPQDQLPAGKKTPQQQKPGQKQQQQQQKPEQKQQLQKTPDKVKPQQQQQQDAGKAGPVASAKKGVRRWENGFEIQDVAMGNPNGKLARAGKKVVVKYLGKLANGKVFDQTKGKSTFTFRLGVGDVIKGWDKGVEGMRVGDKRRLIVPPSMGYGSSRTGPIPPNSTLHFDVELVDVK